MIVFTLIGMLVVAALALALLFVLVTSLLSGRVGKIRTMWRHYAVWYPDTSVDPHTPFDAYTNRWLDKETFHWTFLGARRAARRVRGTRIQNRWSGSVCVARPGWSESANGYRPDYDGFRN